MSIKEVRHLIVFAKVVEKGSFTAAAKELEMSTATTSLYVSRLEENLGSALLYRNTRKLSLTSEGERVVAAAREILFLYERDVVPFSRKRTQVINRKFRIAIPSALIKSVLVDEISKFFLEHTKVRFSLFCSDTHNDIVGECLDLVIRLGSMPDSSLKAKRLFSVKRKVVASKLFLSRHPQVCHPKDLDNLRWIGLTMRPNVRAFQNVAGDCVEVSYTPTVMVDSVEASYRLACSGVGLAAPPDCIIDERDGLTRVLPDWNLEPIPAYAVWPANIVAGSITHDLIRHLETVIPDL